MPDAPRLKPMTTTEIMDGAFRLYKSNFATFLGILAIAYVPVILLIIVGTSFLLTGLQNQEFDPTSDEVPAAVIAFIVVGVGAFLLLSFIAMPMATGALTRAVGARYLNEPTSIRDAYGHVLRIFGKYLGTTILSGLVIGLGFLFCFVPGCLFATWFFASAPICVLEGLGGTAAMGRSRDLVNGHGWRVFGLLVLSFLLQNVISFPVNFAAGFATQLIFRDSLVTQNLVSTALQHGFSMLITPFFSVLLILLYYDLRIRKEAFDLEVLAKNLGKPAPSPAAPPQP